VQNKSMSISPTRFCKRESYRVNIVLVDKLLAITLFHYTSGNWKIDSLRCRDVDWCRRTKIRHAGRACALASA